MVVAILKWFDMLDLGYPCDKTETSILQLNYWLNLKTTRTSAPSSQVLGKKQTSTMRPLEFHGGWMSFFAVLGWVVVCGWVSRHSGHDDGTFKKCYIWMASFDYLGTLW